MLNKNVLILSLNLNSYVQTPYFGKKNFRPHQKFNFPSYKKPEGFD